MKSIYKTEIDLQVIKGWCLLKTYSLSTTKTDKNALFKDENLDPPRCQISLFVVVAVPLLSHIQLCDPMDCSKPSFPVLHCLLEFAQTHVH